MLHSVEDALEFLSQFCNATEVVLRNTTNFQATMVLRDAFVKHGFSKEVANRIATSVKIEISDSAWEDYKVEISEQLAGFAVTIENLFNVYNAEFDLDMNAFLEITKANLSYKLEF